ncbi:Xylulose kinase [Streptomyces violarus]
MYVGIDVGTSMVKTAAFDGTGRELAVSSRPVDLKLHGGFVEQDMEEVYGAVVAVLEELTGRVPGPVELAGLTGQGDGVWLVDGEGRPVRAAASWMDGRAHELVDRWLADGTFETVFRRTGSAMFPGCPGPLLAWLDSNEPKVLDAAKTALYCKDMVFQRLTGADPATDVSDASMPFLDPRTRTYDNRVVELLGLTHRRGLLAPVSDPVATAEARGEGLPSGTRIANGPYDLPACALGAGVTAPGDGLLIVGTCLASLVATTELDLTGEPAGLYISTDRPGYWLRAMPAMVGTAALDWVLSTTGVRHDEVDGLLARTRRARTASVCCRTSRPPANAPRSSSPGCAPNSRVSPWSRPGAIWSAPPARASGTRPGTAWRRRASRGIWPSAAAAPAAPPGCGCSPMCSAGRCGSSRARRARGARSSRRPSGTGSRWTRGCGHARRRSSSRTGAGRRTTRKGTRSTWSGLPGRGPGQGADHPDGEGELGCT